MTEIITSRQNPRLKQAAGLMEKKNRRASGLFRLDGRKLLREALENGAEIVEILVREPMTEQVEELLREAKSRGAVSEEAILRIAEGAFGKVSEEQAPEGVVTVVRQMTRLHRQAAAEELMALAEEMRGERLLLAESLRDPGNLGTVMRTCAALGIDRLILTADCAELYNGKTVRGAMGALFRLPTLTLPESELPRMIRALRATGRRVYATALGREALRIGETELRAGDCFVIGNEGHGLRETTVEACDACAVIPMREGNESLNAAAAAAICVWETVRIGREG